MRFAWWGIVLLMVLGSVGATVATKYNPQFGSALAAARLQHAPRRWLECVIRLSHAPTAEDLTKLKATGFKPRSVVDTIVTGRIQARNADRLIALPLVASIEGGGFGGKKGTRGMK